VTYFSSVKPGLFLYVIRKSDPSWGKNHDHMSKGSVSTHERTVVSKEN
jgi:hypothetical protein